MVQTALITGASGGIGEEFAKVLARKGMNLVLVARSQDKLQALAQQLQTQHNISVKVIAQDLSKVNSAQIVFDQLKDTPIDMLINNAGYGTYGYFHETDLQTELDEMQLNMVTLVHLTKLFLPQMLQRKHGRIMNVASTAAFQSGPLMAVYYATKSFVLNFGEALAVELKGTGVSMTTLCPGGTESGFQQRAAMTESKLVQNNMMTSKKVAEEGIEAMLKGRRVIVNGFRNQALAFLVRLLPRYTVTDMVFNMQKRVGH
jgi:uncharacterized protein